MVFGIDVLITCHALDRFVDAVAQLLEPGAVWTVIEPNSRNPYIWLHQERMRRAGLDEDHFRRAPFERAAARSGLRIVRRATAFVVPGAVRSVPRAVARVERIVEQIPVIGGSVVYALDAVVGARHELDGALDTQVVPRSRRNHATVDSRSPPSRRTT